ncbi:MAG: glycosyltransferase family 1 protein [Alphaproteobacteria bacterium]|nr:glycosyltransferase family 1 protein [Alphaproteobacteria bacterium]
MKKILFIVLFLVCVAGGWYLFANKLDYNKIVFVLPSSNRASSPYFYKKDGDFFLANDLKLGFEKLGYEVEYRFREDYDDLKLKNAGNVIYFKGYYTFKTLPKDNVKKRKNVLYVYYMEGLYKDIFSEVDAVVSASKKFVDEHIIGSGFKGGHIPQYTNPERFKNANSEVDKQHNVLFVGSDHSRKGRKSVDYALKANANLSVYGKFWDESLDRDVLKGSYIDNDELYKYYGNAKIVLNDHRAEMAYFGFVSNRIYDVSASGGFIFTDYVEEIEKEYGDSIIMYKNFDEFNEKLQYYLDHDDERKALAKKAQKITLEKFTNEVAAKKFIEIFKSIKK